MSAHAHQLDTEEKGDIRALSNASPEDPDAEFGGMEARKALEKRLLLKIDLRMSILVVIYILNYVSRMSYLQCMWHNLKNFDRLTETMQGMWFTHTGARTESTVDAHHL